MRPLRLRRLMRSASSTRLSKVGNKIRRFVLCLVPSDYVRRQTALRQGECVGCGRCCKLVFQCPFLGGTDENPRCLIYNSVRPNQCAAFPIDERDLADVNYLCSYSFPQSSAEPESRLLPVFN
ncbi:MAG: hypothetical protein ABIO65_11265 [Nitrospiria bacterium]